MKEASEDPKLKEYIGYTEDQVETGSSLALFTDTGWIWPRSQAFLPSSFWWLAVCKNGGGRPGLFYHVNERFVYLCEAKKKTYCSWFKMKIACVKCVLSVGTPPPPPLSIYVGKTSYMWWNKPSLPPPFLQTASGQKLDGGKVWGRG